MSGPALAVAVALLVPALASASTYEVSVYRTDVGFDTTLAGDAGASTAQTSATWTDGTADGEGQALAEAGFLTGSMAVNAQGNGSPTQQEEAAGGVFLRMVIDDIVVTGPGSEVPVALNVSWGGAGDVGGDDPQMSWNLDRRCTARLDGMDVLGGVVSTGQASQRISAEGTIDAQLTTATATFAVGVPLSAEITLDLSGRARAGTMVGGEPRFTAFARTDFSNFASFSLDGPVFDLPAGFTANSPDGQIVDNVYVPEPATPTAITVGVIALGRAAARRRRLRRM